MYALEKKIHRFLSMGRITLPSSQEEITRLSVEIAHEAATLFATRGKTIQEEAERCRILLMACQTSIYIPNRFERAQTVLARAEKVLPLLDNSPLKVSLLTWCFAEAEEKGLLDEAKAIIASWNPKKRTAEQTAAIKELALFEETIQ